MRRFARWCNGSTADSGSVCHGSNPCRAANSFLCAFTGASIYQLLGGVPLLFSKICRNSFNIVIKFRGVGVSDGSQLANDSVFHLIYICSGFPPQLGPKPLQKTCHCTSSPAQFHNWPGTRRTRP